MLTGRQGERLPDWLYAVRRDDLPSLHKLAAGIDRDRDAVIAGLTLSWKAGVVEGHVNRMVRRQMFGTAAGDLVVVTLPVRGNLAVTCWPSKQPARSSTHEPRVSISSKLTWANSRNGSPNATFRSPS
ncbi:hypothetical protein [Streptomyces sp. NPDC059786]|uniref:hypothetical protein n=1 Tax=Streptomyces sp. NPDC059786 TaxID=3346946 RepID=UPI003666A146